MNTISILSLIIGIVSLLYAFYTTKVFTTGIKIGALQYIRTLINRMEEEKHKHETSSPQWTTMHHTQQDLDALFKNLQKQFGVSDKDALL